MQQQATDYRQYHHEQATHAAQEFSRLVAAGHSIEHLYLCYRETDFRTGDGGRLTVASRYDFPSGYLPITKMPQHVETQDLPEWIRRASGRVPILPVPPRSTT